MTIVQSHRADLPIDAMCEAVGLARATFYRKISPVPNLGRTTRPPSSRALSPAERIRVLEALHEPRFVDQAPADVYATLLDEGVYIASERTMYRILAEQGEVGDRRNQRQHPSYSKPRLMAKGPNEVWSWDITKLAGPRPGTFFHLYVILDIYSRFVPGWLLSDEESEILAEKLFVQTCSRQNIPRDQLTVHSDRGSAMKSRLVGQLFIDLGVTKSHSRPRVSNDNPFSESQFKTLKYRPQFPDRFASLSHAHQVIVPTIDWYNRCHHHEALGLLTPYDVHYGLTQHKLELRQRVLDQTYAAHPERFPNGPPKVHAPAKVVWINEPPPSPEPGPNIAGAEEVTQK